MPRKRKEMDSANIISTLNPLIGVIVLFLSGMAWIESNYAKITWVKEQNEALKESISQSQLRTTQLFEQSKEHSDMNRDRMLAVMSELKDQIRSLELKLHR